MLIFTSEIHLSRGMRRIKGIESTNNNGTNLQVDLLWVHMIETHISTLQTILSDTMAHCKFPQLESLVSWANVGKSFQKCWAVYLIHPKRHASRLESAMCKYSIQLKAPQAWRYATSDLQFSIKPGCPCLQCHSRQTISKKVTHMFLQIHKGGFAGWRSALWFSLPGKIHTAFQGKVITFYKIICLLQKRQKGKEQHHQARLRDCFNLPLSSGGGEKKIAFIEQLVRLNIASCFLLIKLDKTELLWIHPTFLPSALLEWTRNCSALHLLLAIRLHPRIHCAY